VVLVELLPEFAKITITMIAQARTAKIFPVFDFVGAPTICLSGSVDESGWVCVFFLINHQNTAAVGIAKISPPTEPKKHSNINQFAPDHFVSFLLPKLPELTRPKFLSVLRQEKKSA